MKSLQLEHSHDDFMTENLLTSGGNNTAIMESNASCNGWMYSWMDTAIWQLFKNYGKPKMTM